MRRFISVLVFAIACGASDSTGPATRRGITAIDGAGVTDTVVSVLRQALIVEVRDSTGTLAPPGTIARFTATNASISALDANTFSSFVARGVDSAGRTAVLIRLGTLAGTGRVVINVPTLGLVDTASYTVLPGSAARVTVAPADTLVGLGRTFKYRGGVVDQFGNTRADPLTWTVEQGAAVSTDGAFTASSIARYHVVATAAGGSTPRTATLTVSAVPNVRIAAWRNGRMVLMDLDGSNVRDLVAVADGGIGASAQWMPDRTSVIYSTLVGGFQTLYVADTNGTVRPFFNTTPPGVTHQAEPRVTTDGGWVVFGAYDSRCFTYCLYRARSDGTGAELLSSAVNGSNPTFAPSPDGSRVAFSMGVGVRMFDVASRTLSTWTLSTASAPAWSPDGSKIAVMQGSSLALMDPSGSIIRTLPTSSLSSVPRTAWLSDSRYLLARTFSGAFDLIDTQTGDAILLPFTDIIGALSVR